jgi:hypothetical protein
MNVALKFFLNEFKSIYGPIQPLSGPFSYLIDSDLPKCWYELLIYKITILKIELK